MRREDYRTGWLIYSAGHLWDDWVYPSEAAALTTVERCNVLDAKVIQSDRQGRSDDMGRQHSRKLLFDRKGKSRI